MMNISLVDAILRVVDDKYMTTNEIKSMVTDRFELNGSQSCFSRALRQLVQAGLLRRNRPNNIGVILKSQNMLVFQRTDKQVV